jgi:hypothetical protein
MAIFLAIPILGLMVILQSAIFSQVHLLYGTLDLVLLVLVAWSVQERVTTAWHWALIAGLLASFATAVPAVAIIPAYVLATGIALFMRRIFWQRPLLAMVTAIFLGISNCFGDLRHSTPTARGVLYDHHPECLAQSFAGHSSVCINRRSIALALSGAN